MLINRSYWFLLYFEIDYFEIGMIDLGLWGVTGALDIEAKKKIILVLDSF